MLKNDDVKRELYINVDERKKLEAELRALEQELVIYRGNLSELEAANLRDVNTLCNQLSDLRYQFEDSLREIKAKNEEVHNLNKDIV
jgi:hypothetical protein